MRNLSILFLLCLLSACDWSAKRGAKAQKLVDQEIQSIDWEDVDQYPLFSDCDELATKSEQKTCFMETLLKHFSKSLQESDFILEEAVRDTIFVDFRMQGTGSITLINIKNATNIDQQIPGFRKQIEKSLNSLPEIEPALKRGIPVSANFRIPILLQ